jgi:hypothetical protein
MKKIDRKWTENEVQTLKRLRREGWELKAISAEMGRSFQSVCKKVWTCKFRKGNGNRFGAHIITLPYVPSSRLFVMEAGK